MEYVNLQCFWMNHIGYPHKENDSKDTGGQSTFSSSITIELGKAAIRGETRRGPRTQNTKEKRESCCAVDFGHYVRG